MRLPFRGATLLLQVVRTVRMVRGRRLLHTTSVSVASTVEGMCGHVRLRSGGAKVTRTR
jgi:hypothetical protein